MNFLIIMLVVVLVHQHVPVLRAVQQDQWLISALGRVRTAEGAFFAGAILLLVAGPVLLLSALLFSVAHHWWLVFILNALVLMYAIGRASWRTECSQWVELFNEKEPERLKARLAEKQRIDTQTLQDEDVEDIWQKARGEVLCHQLSGFYAVVFWFFLLGAPAALLYRLLWIAHKQWDRDGQGVPAGLDRALWLMEWLPVRVMALFFCFVGQFATTFWVLRQVMHDSITSSIEVLSRCADAALFVDHESRDDQNQDDAAEDPEVQGRRRMERMTLKAMERKTLLVMRGYCRELQALLRHTEIAFLSGLAVITLL